MIDILKTDNPSTRLAKSNFNKAFKNHLRLNTPASTKALNKHQHLLDLQLEARRHTAEAKDLHLQAKRKAEAAALEASRPTSYADIVFQQETNHYQMQRKVKASLQRNKAYLAELQSRPKLTAWQRDTIPILKRLIQNPIDGWQSSYHASVTHEYCDHPSLRCRRSGSLVGRHPLTNRNLHAHLEYNYNPQHH